MSKKQFIYQGFIIEADPQKINENEWTVFINLIEEKGDKMTLKKLHPKKDIIASSYNEAEKECFKFGKHIIDEGLTDI